MRIHEKIYVGGEWVTPTGSGSFDVDNARREVPRPGASRRRAPRRKARRR